MLNPARPSAAADIQRANNRVLTRSCTLFNIRHRYAHVRRLHSAPAPSSRTRPQEDTVLCIHQLLFLCYNVSTSTDLPWKLLLFSGRISWNYLFKISLYLIHPYTFIYVLSSERFCRFGCRYARTDFYFFYCLFAINNYNFICA